MDNWLINLLALVLLGVVLDGARRAYLKHKDSVKVSRNLARSMRQEMEDGNEDILSTPRTVKEAADATQMPEKSSPLSESELEYIDPEEAEKRRQISAELPGTVRVVQRRKPEDASQVNRQVQQNFQSSRKPLAGSKPERVSERSEMRTDVPAQSTTTTRAAKVPEQASLNLEEQVPMLMDSVEPDIAPQAAGDTPSEYTSEDSLQYQGELDPVAGLASAGDESPVTDRREPSLDESISLESLQSVPDDAPVEEPEAPVKKPGWSPADLKLPEIKFPELKKGPDLKKAAGRDGVEDAESPGKKKSGKRGHSGSQEREVQEVLILNIMAPAGDCFEGNDLLRVLLSSGMRFGDMNIFHYHCGEAGEGPALFSLANIVVPGTFDMSEMEDFTTPGVSLFLALPAEVEALKAFDTLLSTARTIAEQLGGELKDENRSVFTAQTAEHYRQRVMEFQRRTALARAQA
ncbi:cell division protein ZipA [Microbulbifer elongatus]|uniref:Cell division protein ZipA n=1 Tax=Microbulbifer elongatus TaxID=86173 RepID=A0ABT1P302_9GAMM|nr:cell division protein ZipA [Microbulbifer elongatus]MCQ3830501.1 cell division protein ZipA [Microbulbifer elongatus]